jgi:hypothetical protein
MEVYRIDSSHKKKATDTFGKVIDVGSRTFLKAEMNFYSDKYGLNLSRYEIEYHKFVLQILRHFVEHSRHEWCMIYERGVKITNPFKVISESLNKIPDDTDIFFPFDKTEVIKQKAGLKLSGSRFETYWGSFIFFVSKKGAKKILDYKKINLPFDEMLLELSFSGIISSIFAETEWFQYDERISKSYNSRRNQVKKAIFGSTAWKNDDKKQAIALLSRLIEHAERLNIKLMLHAGSLLGHIRHNGIMPWDDDIDISILSDEVEKFNDSINKEGTIRITKWVYKKTGSSYFKYWLEGGEKVEGYEYSFPFIDFWIVYPDGREKVKMTDGYVFDKSDYLPPQSISFEGLPLNIPNKPFVVLDQMYKTWRTEIKVFSWCHRLKQPVFNPLKMPIEVDENGIMI